MSRIGKIPVDVPANVKVAIQGQTINVEGPKGKLTWQFDPVISVTFDESAKQIVVDRADDEKHSKALHGLTRSIVENMVIGVSEGYIKTLEMYGAGYSCKLEGQKLVLQVGFAHPVEFAVPTGIEVKVLTPAARGTSTPAVFSISGADKQVVGQFAADCRKCRPAEPYQGKGLRFQGEQIKRKAGKAFAGGGG